MPERIEDLELLSAGWDLGPLVDGGGGAGAERLLVEAVKRAGAFAEAHAGRITRLDADGLARAMTELAAIRDLAGRAQCYAELRFATDTGDQACGAFLQFAQERVAEIDMKLVFLRARVDGAAGRPRRRAPCGRGRGS